MQEGFEGLVYPWEILPKIPTLMHQLAPSLPRDYDQIAPNVWVGRGTVIADTARFTGPAIIGYDCEIRPGAYIRENVIVGHEAVIGNSTEVREPFYLMKCRHLILTTLGIRFWVIGPI